MGFVPLFVQVRDKPCLVVGGGEVALRKVQPLLEAGARVSVICLKAVPELDKLAASGRISLIRRAYRSGDMEGCLLVYAATDDPKLQRLLFDEAARRNILVNVADAPEFCSFIVPSIIRRGRLQVAVSTAGASPAAARTLRRRIEQSLGEEIEVFVELMAAARAWLKEHEPNPAMRARKLNALAESGLDDALRRRDRAAVQRIFQQCLGRGVELTGLNLDL